MIAEQIIKDVAQLVLKKGPSEETVRELRNTLPELHFTYCFDDDVCGPKPIAQEERFNIYLVNGSGHCTTFTPSLEAATGLVIAEVDETFCA